MRLNLARALPVSCCLLAICSCSRNDSDEVAKLKAEVAALKVEVATTKAEAEAAKAELARLKETVGSPAKGGGEEQQVLDASKAFIANLAADRLTTAYLATSAAYQKQTDRKSFDELIGKHPGLRELEPTQYHEHNVRKRADGKGYDFYFTAREQRPPKGYTNDNLPGPGPSPGLGPKVNLLLTLVQESGAWKVDSLEITREKPN